MTNNKIKLVMYEALELRAEYEARLKTFKDTLPESIKSRKTRGFYHDERESFKPSPDYDLVKTRGMIKNLEFKFRKINTAIQKSNFNYELAFEDETINLNEALELRKSLNHKIGELHDRVVAASHLKTIHKEERDIVEERDSGYQEILAELDQARISFRVLNRLIRKASYDIVIEYFDE